MFWFKKLLTYTIEYKDRPNEVFNKSVSQYTKMYIKDIFLKATPIDLQEAYSFFQDKPND